MIASLLPKYEAVRVPRYTSYPTAPHFTPANGPETAAARYRAIPPDTPISAYLHVPFCRVLCWYCGCNTRVVSQYDPIAGYAQSLAEEIALVGNALPDGVPIGHLHWGGGSPTALSAEDFRRIMGDIARRWPLTDDAEVAIEIDPRTLTPAFVDAMAETRINRVSLGIQCFDPKVQKAINRVQSVEVTRAALDRLAAAGIGDANFDLVYGLPHQTVDSVVATVDASLALGARRFSVFAYAHLPTLLKHQALIDPAALPDGAARLDQFLAISERVTAAGMVPIGLDHFAWPDDPLAVAGRDGTLRRNFQGYTPDPCETLVGFGASAIGASAEGYLQNHTATADYRRAVTEGRLPIAKSLTFQGDDRLRGRVIESLMCFLSVDLAAVAREFDCPAEVFAGDLPRLDPLERDGLVHRDGWRLTVPAEARPLMRVVAAAFDAYLDPAHGRHAVAV